MRILRKVLRRLYHLIAFLSLFIILCPNVHASSINVPFNGFITSYENKSSSIACNANNCVVTGVRYYFNQDFTTKWTANSSYTCQNGASLTGKFNMIGSGEWVANGDWLSDHVKSVFLDTNGTRYACSFSTGNQGSYGLINYTCYAPKLTANFSLGYIFARSTSANIYANAGEVIINRNITYDCDNTAGSINENNNINTDRIISNNNSNSAKERQKIQENTDAINGLKEKQNETNNTLKDSSVDSSDGTLNNLKGNVPTNNVISSLILLPVKFLQSIVSSLGGSCSSFNLGSLYNHDLVLPCINIESYLGSGIWTFIDLVFSAMFILIIRKKFIQIYENITNLRNGVNEVD